MFKLYLEKNRNGQWRTSRRRRCNNLRKKILRWWYVEKLLDSWKSHHSNSASERSNGGFNLTKLINNNTAVFKSILDDSRRTAVKNEELALGCLSEDKALGVKWDTEKDTLGFMIKLVEKPSTRRGLLSMLSINYDPLGLGAHLF